MVPPGYIGGCHETWTHLLELASTFTMVGLNCGAEKYDQHCHTWKIELISRWLEITNYFIKKIVATFQ